MVLQKRLDYGFNGYQAPPIPRAARSARKRPKINKRGEENKMCAIDLLATVAGNLLLEKVSSSSSSSKGPIANEKEKENEERVDDNKKEFKVEPCNQSTIRPNPVFEEFLSPQQDDHSGFSSVMTASNCSERLVVTKKNSDDGEIKNEVVSLCSKVEEDEPPKVYSNIGGCKLDGEASNNDNSNILVKDESTSNEAAVGARADTCGLKSPVVSAAPEMKMESLAPSHSNVKIVSRDDDENSSGCTHPSPRSRTRSKCIRQAQRIGDRRIRKILASKHWRPTPRYKDDSDRVFKPNFRSRKECYKRQRSHVAIPIKKRKLYDHNSAWATDEGKGTSRSVGQHASLQRRDSQMKLRIKSFRVPELIIEIPETATVGSLKRTVMEAVTAILGGELRIGVILQGQKVRDDSVTLLQSGISHDEHLDSLGFTLEPNKPSQIQNQNQKPAPLCAGESHHFLPGNDDPKPLPLVSFLSSRGTDNEGISNISPKPNVIPDSGNSVESDRDSAPSPIEMSIEKRTLDSKALVLLPEISPKALSVVPAIRKKHPEMSQRRIRRPFSVTEVEALVHAVEKLGTGRWRDVKLRAFDDAKHRTYVDLKDKWKTLVHTARIAPQQRRGEPVPQELLDRVLNAHSYWSQQQAKQHSQTCLLI